MSLGSLHVCTHMCMYIHAHAKYIQKHTYIVKKKGGKISPEFIYNRRPLYKQLPEDTSQVPRTFELVTLVLQGCFSLLGLLAFGENGCSLRQGWPTQSILPPWLFFSICDSAIACTPCPRCSNFAKVEG